MSGRTDRSHLIVALILMATTTTGPIFTLNLHNTISTLFPLRIITTATLTTVLIMTVLLSYSQHQPQPWTLILMRPDR